MCVYIYMYVCKLNQLPSLLSQAPDYPRVNPSWFNSELGVQPERSNDYFCYQLYTIYIYVCIYVCVCVCVRVSECASIKLITFISFAGSWPLKPVSANARTTISVTSSRTPTPMSAWATCRPSVVRSLALLCLHSTFLYINIYDIYLLIYIDHIDVYLC